LDFIGNRKIWFTVSIVLVVFGLLLLGIRGLNFGIDFLGGSLLEYKFEEQVPLGEFQSLLTEHGLDGEGLVIQPSEQEDIHGILLRGPAFTVDEREELFSALEGEFGTVEVLRAETVWPTIGEELRWRAILALAVASVIIVGYISIRFEPKYAIAAIIALFHDVFIVLGFIYKV